MLSSIAKRSFLGQQRLCSRALSSEIAVNQVARVFRAHVGCEADALSLDAVTKKSFDAVKALPGFVRATRTSVCTQTKRVRSRALSPRSFPLILRGADSRYLDVF